MEQVKTINAAIVGGGPGCKAMIKMISSEKLRKLRMKLIGVACRNANAVGYIYAQEKGIYTTEEYRDLYKLKELNMIIELTGREDVADEILETKPRYVRLMDHVVARLFWGVFQTREARITEREQAEKQIRESEEKYRTVLEASPDPIAVYDMAGKVIYLNPAFTKVFGWTSEELLGKKIDYVPEENWPETQMMIDIVLAGESFSGIKSRRYTKKRSILDVSISVATYLDRDGIPVGSVHTLRDITDRKRTEEALRESEERYHMVLEASPDPIVTYDMEGNCTYINPAFTRIFGWMPEELLGKKLDYVPDENWPETKMMIEKVQAGESFSRVESCRYTKAGNILDVSISAATHLNRDGIPVGSVHILRDITDRKRAEKALRESEKKYRDLAESLSALIYRADPKTFAARYVNRAVERLYGYTVQEWLEGPSLWERSIHPDDRERVLAEYIEARSKTENIILEYRSIRKDRAIRWMEDHISFEKDAQDNAVSINGVVYDITERKQVQKELRRYRQHLEQLVEERTLKLTRANKELELGIIERQRAEEALCEGEATLKSIFRAAPTGIGMVSNRVLKRVNDRICEMTGYSREELVEQNARMLYPTDEDFEYVGREKYAQIRERGTGTVETRWKRKDGKVIDVMLSSTAVDPGDLKAGVTFTALDITERKKAEEELRESEERYRRITGAITDYIYTVTVQDGRPVETVHGPACAAVTGYTAEDFKENPYLWIQMVHEKDREAVEKLAADTLSGVKVPALEHRIIRKDGATRWVRNTPVLNLDGYGRLLSYDGLLQDVTERKQAEEALRKAHDELERFNLELEEKVRERTKELEQKSKQLVKAERLAALGKMANRVAHELRNPLTAVGGFARRINEKMPTDDPNKKYLQVIVQQVITIESKVSEITRIQSQ